MQEVKKKKKKQPRKIKSSHPSSAHLYSLLPPSKTLRALLGRNLRLEQRPALGVDFAEVFKRLPHTRGHAGGDGGAKGGGLTHLGPVDGHPDEVCLGLLRRQKNHVSSCIYPGRVGWGDQNSPHTCMVKSELHMPPSTASSSNALPLSLCMASRMAFVWKQVASRVARATWAGVV